MLDDILDIFDPPPANKASIVPQRLPGGVYAGSGNLIHVSDSSGTLTPTAVAYTDGLDARISHVVQAINELNPEAKCAEPPKPRVKPTPFDVARATARGGRRVQPAELRRRAR
jgi:hypothetical protein